MKKHTTPHDGISYVTLNENLSTSFKTQGAVNDNKETRATTQ
ncbi:hypothetical protein [Photobacterium kishitanii]|nr:hypothetical protein [Photobacterium kishitanii]